MTDKEKKEIELILNCVFLQIKDGHLDRAWDVYDEFKKQFKHFIDSLQEEPVSEELEKAAEKAAVETFFVSPKWTEIRKELFKAGANWQEKKDQSTIELAEDHAMLAGMEKMREQMMKDAVEQDVDSIWANPINTLERLGLQNFNGKVKLIIIKEE